MEQHPIYCPSCGSEITGNYCAACGERIRTGNKELSLTFFLKDAVEEVFSLDSKFIRTLKLLIIKPGFLTTEAIAGRRTQYIKPIRLYSIVVVLHFLIFSFAKSGDLFSVEHFPFFKLFPSIYQLIHSYEIKSGLTHDVFTKTLNQNMKDNLNIILYFLVFVLAGYFKILYLKSGKYYIEHLYYLLHIISFGLIRNVVIIPLLVLDQMVLALLISAITQLAYTYISLKVVYGENAFGTSIKMILGMSGFILVFLPGVLLSLVIGIIQIMF